MPLVKPAWLTLVILCFQSLWGATGGKYIYDEAKFNLVKQKIDEYCKKTIGEIGHE